jgi:hypothetical protein
MRRTRMSRGIAYRCAVLAVALAGLMAFASPAQADFGVNSFTSSLLDGSGAVDNPAQAGAHPFAQQVSFSFNTTHHHYPGPPPGSPGSGSGADPDPDGAVKTIVTDLPPGLLGNPQAAPFCQQSDFPPQNPTGIGTSNCPTASQIGVATVKLGALSGGELAPTKDPIYNLVPPKGVIARIGFVALIPIVIDIKLRTGGDYGITATVKNTSEVVNIYKTTVTLWGVPADSSHDLERYEAGTSAPGQPSESGNPLPAGLPRRAFMSNPTRCGVESTTGLAVDSWENPGNFLHYTAPEPMSFTGCNEVEFEPTIEAKPTTNLADAPSGMDFNLHIPQHNETLPGKNEEQNLSVHATKGQFRLGFEGEVTGATGSGDLVGPVAASADLTNLSAVLTNVNTTSGAFTVGQTVEGSGIPGGTTILALNPGAIQLSAAAEATAAGVAITGLSSTTVSNVSTSAGAFVVGEEISGAGIPAGTTIVAVEQGKLTLSQPATATSSAVALSADLPFNAPAAAVQGALQALPAIGTGAAPGSGGVAVSGGPGDETGSTPYAIGFRGRLADRDVPQITATNGAQPLQIGATPGSASVSTTTSGVPDPLSTAHLKDAVVTLPAGMTVNPPSAAVLDACSLSQVGMSASAVANENPIACPNASILGKATVVTPALDHPLPGIVYLAKQNENPFNSLLAMYLVIDDPISGVFVKLAGKIEADPNTGQLTVSFKNNPQLPVEDLTLDLPGGPHASLRTPAGCGQHTTTSVLTPWTAPEGPTATPSSSFPISASPSGGACLPTGASAPNTPTFTAGTLDPTAKAYSPFVFKLGRADGSQPLAGIDTTLPKGLIGKLAGIPYCSDAALAAAATKTGKAELASPSCPAASRVGGVDVGAGAGPTPIYVSGNAYLAGPYKGAPISLAVITPAVAGPFDLGNVVVRNALYVNPETAEVRAVSDPLPTILQGIPLDLRSIVLKMDRPDFTLNPTNCNPLAITGSALSVFGQSAALSSPFQADECAKLGFKPSLKFSLGGETKRTGNPSLRAVINYPKTGAYANIAKTAVLLPSTTFIDNEHISNPCTRPQFDANACPAKSILGTARAFTPLLDKPLEGPVYFRANGGARELPDMVVDLNGQIHVTLVGFIDSVGKKGSEKRRVRTRFANVPDAPVSKFVLNLYGGKRGLLENSVNLCKHPGEASVLMDAQNGKVEDFDTPFAADCATKKSKRDGRR